MADASPHRCGDNRVLPNWLTLLESGLFADVTVRCGAREWKLHRAVICVQSVWFEKALCGGFKEAESREIKIEEIEPNLLDWVIKCIYYRADAHKVDLGFLERFDDLHKMLNAPDTGMLAHMHLHEAADYFALPEFSQVLEQSLERFISRFEHSILEAYPKETVKLATHTDQPKLFELLPQEDRDFLFQAIDHAFLREYQSEGIQKLFSELVRKTNFWILHDKAFKEKLSSVPKLAASILGLMMESELGQVFHTVPRKCEHGRKFGKGQHISWAGLRLGVDAKKVVVGTHGVS